MATEQDHVWAMLDDMLVFLSKRHVRTPERTYKLDGGWTLAMDDLRRFVDNLIAERDQLRAELAAAKEEIAKMRATIISAMVDVQHNLPGTGHAKLSLLLDGIMKAPRNNEERLLAERDQLAAHVERLEKTLKGVCKLRKKTEATHQAAYEAMFKLPGRKAFEDAAKAIAATPAQSLAAHDAALLREVVAELRDTAIERDDSTYDIAAYMVDTKADRIEKEAANG